MDEEGCDQINDDDQKERCLKVIAQNKEVIELAQKTAEQPKKTTAEVLTGCDALDEEKAQKCRDEMNEKLATEKREVAYCHKIEDTQKKNDCIDNLSVASDRLYLREAIAMKDPSACQKLTDTKLKETCLEYLQ